MRCVKNGFMESLSSHQRLLEKLQHKKHTLATSRPQQGIRRIFAIFGNDEEATKPVGSDQEKVSTEVVHAFTFADLSSVLPKLSSVEHGARRQRSAATSQSGDGNTTISSLCLVLLDVPFTATLLSIVQRFYASPLPLDAIFVGGNTMNSVCCALIGAFIISPTVSWKNALATPCWAGHIMDETTPSHRIGVILPADIASKYMKLSLTHHRAYFHKAEWHIAEFLSSSHPDMPTWSRSEVFPVYLSHMPEHWVAQYIILQLHESLWHLHVDVNVPHHLLEQKVGIKMMLWREDGRWKGRIVRPHRQKLIQAVQACLRNEKSDENAWSKSVVRAFPCEHLHIIDEVHNRLNDLKCQKRAETISPLPHNSDPHPDDSEMNAHELPKSTPVSTQEEIVKPSSDIQPNLHQLLKPKTPPKKLSKLARARLKQQQQRKK